MDWRQIDSLRRDLDRFLEHFDDCFARSEGRGHLRRYVGGQLSALQHKCVEPIADRAGIAPRTLQDFLALHTWDHERAIDRLQEIVAEHHGDALSIGLIDETSYLKRGDKTAGVQRQYCGAVGNNANCVVSVHLGYATGDGQFRCGLDSRLYLPKSWCDDRKRCRQAGIPDDARFQTKCQIALDLIRRAQSNGVRFAYLTFDAYYSQSIWFLEALHTMGQTYVAEVAKDFHGWLLEPKVLQKAHYREKRRKGPNKRYPRLSRQSPRPHRVDRLCRHSHLMRDRPWQMFHVKDGRKGPILWRAKAARFRINVPVQDMAQPFTLPSSPVWLVVVQNVLSGQIKYFVSNAPAGTPLEVILHVAFSRWHIERCFEDEKGQLGLDHFECRRYVAIRRHMLITDISHLFLNRICWQLRKEGGKKSDHSSTALRRGRVDLCLTHGSRRPHSASAAHRSPPEHHPESQHQGRSFTSPCPQATLNYLGH